MAARPTSLVLSAAAVLLLAGCTGEDDPGLARVASPAGPPAVLANTPHMAGATRLLAERGSGPGTFELPDTAAFASLVLTVTCPSDDTPTGLVLVGSDGTEARMGSDGCNAASYETPPLDAAVPPVAVRVDVPRDADYTVFVYGTQLPVTG